MIGLNERNTVIVTEAVADLYKRIFEQEKNLNALNSAIAALMARTLELETAISIWRMSSIGHGPTE